MWCYGQVVNLEHVSFDGANLEIVLNQTDESDYL